MSNAARTTDLTVAHEIQRQLGRQTFALLGASQLIGDATSLMFSFKGCPRINKIRITLTPDDLYRVEFFKFSPTKLTCNVVSSHEGIYCDQLHDLIESETGLYTTFNPR